MHFPTMTFWRGVEKLGGLYSVYEDDEVGDFPSSGYLIDYAHSWKRDIYLYACTSKATDKYVFATEAFLQLLREAV